MVKIKSGERHTIIRMNTWKNNFSSQGNFPRMENIAAFKPVSTSPTRSTCGVPERSSYCQSPSSQTELMTCYQAFCVQECPYRSSTPPYAPLLLSAHRYITFIMLFRSFVEARSSPFNPGTIKNSICELFLMTPMWHMFETLCDHF